MDNSTNLLTLKDKNIGEIDVSFTATAFPKSITDVYANRLSASMATTLAGIDIRPVLRVLVNNETFIHSLIAPVLKEDLINREGGQYFAYQTDANGNLVLFGGNTAKELYMCIDANIPANQNKTMLTLQSPGLFESLLALKAMYLSNNITADAVTISHAQDLTVPGVGQEQDEAHPHCEECIANGLDGLHGWNNNGTVYADDYQSRDSLYKRTDVGV